MCRDKALWTGITLALAGCVLAHSPAPAAQRRMVYDGFAYPPERKLQGLNGGTGWAGPWGQHGPGGQTQTVAEGLTFGDLAVSGGACVTTSQAPVGNPRPLAREYGYGGTTLYFSFLMRPLDPVSGRYYGFGIGNVFIGKSTRHPNYVIEHLRGAGIAPSDVEAQQDATAFVVVRITCTTGNDKVELFVNPKPGSPLPEVADAVKADTDIGRSATGGFGADLRCVLDEWRMGYSYEDVCPTKDSRQVARR